MEAFGFQASNKWWRYSSWTKSSKSLWNWYVHLLLLHSNLISLVCNITTFLFSYLLQPWERDAPSTTLFLLAMLRGKRSAIIATHGAWWILSNWKHEQVLEYLVNQQGWSQSVGLLSPSDRGGLKSSWGFRQFGSSVNFDQLCNHIGLGIYQVYTISRRSLTTS